MCANKVSVETLRALEPLASLSDARLNELAGLARVEIIGKDSDASGTLAATDQVVYLVRGELALTYPDGSSRVLAGGSTRARRPLARHGEEFAGARAISEVELLRIDNEIIDIMLTWDQVASATAPKTPGTTQHGKASPANWSLMTGMFSVNNLKFGAFSQLPPAHIDELLRLFVRVAVKKGDVVIREGAEGDFYYVIETGRCKVERMIGGVSMLLADLKAGDAFGEEALVSEAKRNATVTMKTDGVVLRLAKGDFNELLRQPFLHRVTMDEARSKIAGGGQWVDVRYPSEYQYDKLPGAINIPLSEIRNAVGVLDRQREYVLYCQSERRSAAAAFLLAQRGYRAFLLAGGLWRQATPGT
jgi:rhodanese-related sulfurtransferase